MSDEVSRFGAAMVPDDGLSEEVDVDLDEVNAPAAGPPPAASSGNDVAAVPKVVAAVANVDSGNMRASEPPARGGDGRAERKPRPRMSLRVPDDEVVRPQTTSFTRTGETRVFRTEELEKEATDAVGATASAPLRPSTVTKSVEPPPPPLTPPVSRPRAPSVSSEVTKIAPPRAMPLEAPRPRHGSISSESALPVPRPRAGSVSSEISALPVPRPRAGSVSSEMSATPRPPARSVSSEMAAAKPLESAPEVEPEPDSNPGAEPIKPARIISFHPVLPAPAAPAEPAEPEVPTDGPTLAELPPLRESVDGIPVSTESSREISNAIPVIEETEPFELRTTRKTDPAPPPRTTISMRVPAMTIPDTDGFGSFGIDISLDDDGGDVPQPEAEVGSDDLLSIDSSPDLPPPAWSEPRDVVIAQTPANGTATPRPLVPLIGMSSDPHVAAQLTQTPPGGINVPSAPEQRAAAPASPAIVPAHESRDAARLPAKASLVAVPDASPLAPPSMGDAAANRKRQRPWWEELFNDDFIRTMAKITDEQIAREVDFIEDSLGVARGAMILDMACGTGRHAIELTRRGYRVVGLDLSLAMLARAAEEAQERNQKLNFVQGDMREMTFEDMFDGVYCWNTSFGFFEEERNAQVIQRVHRALRKGGQFVLDVMNRDFALLQQPSLVWFEGDGCICMDEMAIDWITSRMRVKRTMMMDDGRSREIEYSLRIYSLHELGKVLHDHGFRVAEVSGRTATPGVFFGAESPNVLILAEKR